MYNGYVQCVDINVIQLIQTTHKKTGNGDTYMHDTSDFATEARVDCRVRMWNREAELFHCPRVFIRESWRPGGLLLLQHPHESCDQHIRMGKSQILPKLSKVPRQNEHMSVGCRP